MERVRRYAYMRKRCILQTQLSKMVIFRHKMRKFAHLCRKKAVILQPICTPACANMYIRAQNTRKNIVN